MECSLVSWRFPCSWRFSFLSRHHLVTSSHGIGKYWQDFYGIVDLTFGWAAVGDVMSRTQAIYLCKHKVLGLINCKAPGRWSLPQDLGGGPSSSLLYQASFLQNWTQRLVCRPTSLLYLFMDSSNPQSNTFKLYFCHL